MERLMELLFEKTLIKGIKAHKSGQVQEAVRLYSAILESQPDHPEVNHSMGLLAVKMEDALRFFKVALESDPSVDQFWLSYINTLIKFDRITDAKAMFARAKEKGISGEAFDMMGQKLFTNNKTDLVKGRALQSFKSNILDTVKLDKALRLASKNKKNDQIEEAKDIYQDILKKFPKHKQALAALKLLSGGTAPALLQDPPPNKLNSLVNLYNQGQLKLALLHTSQLLESYPHSVILYNLSGASNAGLMQFDAAIKSYKQALKIKPDYVDALNNMGVAQNSKGDPEAAIQSYKSAIKIKPDYADALNNMGAAQNSQGDLEAAIQSYKSAIKIQPDYADAYFNMGIALQDKGYLKSALDSFTIGLKIKPYDQQYQSQKLYLQARMCDWIGVGEEEVLISELGTTNQHIDPFTMLALEDAPERHRLRSEIYSNHTFKQTPLPLPTRPSQKPKRLRIGYFSADFKNHPVMYGLIEILERHNRKLFEIYAYSFGPDTDDEMRLRVINAVDVFDDVKNMSDQDISRLARQDSIDIAIDLTGFTKNSRTGIFAYRAAPIQVSMFGYPGTLGTSFMDYCIADQTVLPPEDQRFYSENPIYVPQPPCGLEASIPLLEETPMRSELGLPVEGFVFCAINNTYKITPAEFDIWMRLLHHVEGSVLWLLESNKWARTNLIKEAEARGISSERLVFQPMMVKDRDSQQRYLSQFRHADLYLDTFIYGGGSTAANALWAGLPVLTLIGQGVTTRMAACYLNALGLSELITTTSKDYERLAFELSKNPERLALLKQKLADKIKSGKLFDNTLQTQYIESGYQQAYQRYFNGDNPSPIYISE